jgi:hypothetical protein
MTAGRGTLERLMMLLRISSAQCSSLNLNWRSIVTNMFCQAGLYIKISKFTFTARMAQWYRPFDLASAFRVVTNRRSDRFHKDLRILNFLQV